MVILAGDAAKQQRLFLTKTQDLAEIDE